MKIVILLGGNIGNTLALFNEAIHLLKQEDIENLKHSLVYQSPSWGYESDNNYLNQVISFDSDKDADDLLGICLAIEKKLGRIRNDEEGYVDRPIDIDILYIGDQHIEKEHLHVPHPRLHIRKFTLLPLAELLPEFIHPILKMDHKSLLLLCPDKSKVEPIN